MTGGVQMVLRSPTVNRRHPLLRGQPSTMGSSARFAEVAGGTAAECAVICCCCPCGLLNLAVLALYKVPAGLCRRMLRRKRRRQQRLLKTGLVQRRRCTCGCDDVGGGGGDGQVYPVGIGMAATLNELERIKEEKEVMRLEKEMWDTFYSTGFWRNPSQREES